jgi:hypothetical protein
VIATQETIMYEAAIAQSERRRRFRNQFPLTFRVIEAFEAGPPPGGGRGALAMWEDVWRICDRFALDLIAKGKMRRARRECDENYGVHGRAGVVCPWCGSTEIGPRLCATCKHPHLIGAVL